MSWRVTVQWALFLAAEQRIRYRVYSVRSTVTRDWEWFAAPVAGRR